jgi:hypothetical protein
MKMYSGMLFVIIRWMMTEMGQGCLLLSIDTFPTEASERGVP